MRGNFGLFRTFSPKLPRIHVDYIVMQMRKINREKGYFPLINVMCNIVGSCLELIKVTCIFKLTASQGTDFLLDRRLNSGRLTYCNQELCL